MNYLNLWRDMNSNSFKISLLTIGQIFQVSKLAINLRLEIFLNPYGHKITKSSWTLCLLPCPWKFQDFSYHWSFDLLTMASYIDNHGEFEIWGIYCFGYLMEMEVISVHFDEGRICLFNYLRIEKLKNNILHQSHPLTHPVPNLTGDSLPYII